jgi:putrescine transport system substrate-binding protein
MAEAAKYDPGNEHAFIYMWGTTGIAYNVDKIRERMPEAPVDSWQLVFDPEVAAKFQDCGIMMLDSADDIIPIALNYAGEDPDSKNLKTIEKGAEVLAGVRPFVRKFHSSENINALANGDICISVMYSGDAGIAATRAEEAGSGVDIEYVIPKEGALLWFDMMAMPKDAPNPESAYAFMNHILQPEVIAKASDYVTYPNAVPASLPLISEEVKGDPNLFPPDELKQKLFVVTPYDQRVQRGVTRLWTRVVTGG